jgi:hypothetical protein
MRALRRRVVIPGGQRTLRLVFADSVPERRRLELLRRLGRLSGSFDDRPEERIH